MTYAIHTANNHYYLGYGSYVKGVSVDSAAVRIKPLKLTFPLEVNGRTELKVMLSENNTWSAL